MTRKDANVLGETNKENEEGNQRISINAKKQQYF